MIDIYLQLLATALLTSAACALPGTFLILRGTSFISDALGHAILLGIVLSFFVTQTIHSPWMFVGATLAGLFTVACIEWLISTKRLHHDSAIGLMFPLLFAIAVILINLYTNNIHLDLDAVLLGELAFAPLNQFYFYGHNLGPIACFIMGAIFLLHVIVISTYFKALSITTFDDDYASLLNFSPHRVHYLIMTLTCITIVGAFECAGAILVVAFMVTAPATAYLVTKRLSHMLVAAVLFGMIGAVSGCIIAHWFNVSIAGCIAVSNGVWFLIVLMMKKWTFFK